MTQPPRPYLSYLPRLRRIGEGGELAWRASLEEPGSNHEIRFDDLAALWAYLIAQLEALEEKGGDI